MTDTLESKTIAKFHDWTVNARTAVDQDSTVEDADCYTDAQKSAWRADEWRYVGVIVSVSFKGVKIGEDSLWGVEDGFWTDTEEDDTVIGTRSIGPFADGYPLIDVAGEALGSAQTWLDAIAATHGETMKPVRVPVIILSELVESYVKKLPGYKES